MSNLHVVYRVDDPGTPQEQWSSYSFPYGVYVTGGSLDEVRSEFRAAAGLALTDLDEVSAIEHVERPLGPGAYIRVAVDRRTLDRDATARVMRASLQVIDQWNDFQRTLPPAATDDTVVIACVPDDRLSWIFEQMSDHDAIGLCALGPSSAAGQLVWWSFVMGQHASGAAVGEVEPLSAAGLTTAQTVAEFMRATSRATGRRLVANAS